jgi:Raf kinase inhibitor-like YbhB/YbcL family protein
MQLISPAFAQNQHVPTEYTCKGNNISPPLQIKEVPKDTKSLVLFMHDPDAPVGDWVHWTVWNIPPDTEEIPENSVPEGAVEGTTSFKDTGYGGPCPPWGTHRYIFDLYALDTVLDLKPGAGSDELTAAIKDHISQQTELVGVFSR